MKSLEEAFEGADKESCKLHNVLVPLAMLVGFAVYFDIDVWMGLIATMPLTLPFYLAQRLMPLARCSTGWSMAARPCCRPSASASPPSSSRTCATS